MSFIVYCRCGLLVYLLRTHVPATIRTYRVPVLSRPDAISWNWIELKSTLETTVTYTHTVVHQ